MEKSDFSSANDYWKYHFKNFEKSGDNYVEYCQKFKINPQTFAARKSEIKRLKARPPAKVDSSKFVSLVKLDNPKERQEFKITIFGTEFSFEQRPDPAWIAQVLIELKRYSYV
jgi:hypothetical protein